MLLFFFSLSFSLSVLSFFVFSCSHCEKLIYREVLIIVTCSLVKEVVINISRRVYPELIHERHEMLTRFIYRRIISISIYYIYLIYSNDIKKVFSIVSFLA